MTKGRKRRKQRKRRRKQQGRKTTGKENQKSMEKLLSSCYVNAIPLTSSRLALQHSPPVFIHLQDSSGFLRILQDFLKRILQDSSGFLRIFRILKGFLRILFSGFFCSAFFRIFQDFFRILENSFFQDSSGFLRIFQNFKRILGNSFFRILRDSSGFFRILLIGILQDSFVRHSSEFFLNFQDS